MSERHKIRWEDMEKEPECAPNPLFPKGRDVDASRGAERTCTVKLPYPAKRIGYYFIECARCKKRVGLSTAGRADDPRSIKIACGELPQ